MRTSHLSISVGLLSGLALMGLGCNPLASLEQKVGERVAEGVAERALENAGGGKFDVDLNGTNGEAGGLTVRDNKTGDFYITGTNVKIPDDFPKDIPAYKDATTMAVSFTKKSNSGFLLQQTSDDVAKVADWYKSQLQGAGFTNDGDMDAGTAKILSFKKGTVTISVSITRDDATSKTSIQAARDEESGS